MVVALGTSKERGMLIGSAVQVSFRVRSSTTIVVLLLAADMRNAAGWRLWGLRLQRKQEVCIRWLKEALRPGGDLICC